MRITSLASLWLQQHNWSMYITNKTAQEKSICQVAKLLQSFDENESSVP